MCVSVGSFAVVDGDIFLSHGGRRGVAPRLCLDRGKIFLIAVFLETKRVLI